MGNIVFETVLDGNIEQCRELCNELMAFQKSKAGISPESFDLMNFDTRMKPSYANALDAHVVVVKDDGVPVGYVFSSIESIEEGDKSSLPDWAPSGDQSGWMAFYPDWDDLPEKCGCLNHLYLRKGYRGTGIGSKLYDMSMDWMKNHGDIDLAFVYISNGNDSALDFYLRHGFTFSHDVFGGFIKAAYCRLDK